MQIFSRLQMQRHRFYSPGCVDLLQGDVIRVVSAQCVHFIFLILYNISSQTMWIYAN